MPTQNTTFYGPLGGRKDARDKKLCEPLAIPLLVAQAGDRQDAIGLIARYKGVSDIKPNREESDEAEPHEYFGRDR